MSIPSRLLNKTATLYTKAAGTVNEFGEAAFSWSALAEAVKVSLQPSKEELNFTLHGHTYACRNIVYVNYRTDIIPGDYIEIDSVKYLVVSVENEAGRSHHLKLFVTK